MSTWLNRSRARLLVGTILVLLFIWPFFIPEIVSTYWHLRFGDSATFNHWKVPVPKGWSAFTREGMLVIQKPTRFYEKDDPPAIIPEVLNPDKPVDPEQLKHASIQVISAKGYSFQEERRIQIGPESGYCLLFTSDRNPKDISIACDSLAAKLSVRFFGPRSEIETFYTVVSRITAFDDTGGT